MAMLLESWWSEAVLAVFVLFAAFYLWFLYWYTYWRQRGVPYAEAVFPYGSIGKETILGKMRVEFKIHEIYERYRDERFLGIYALHTPALLVMDPDLIRDILVKDFDAFQDRCIPFDDSEPLNQHLLFLNGSKWKRLRSKLTPAFTSGKLKMMFETMDRCGREMVEVLDDAALSGQVLEVRDVSARFTTDVIGSVAFGVECNCQRNPDAEFRQWGRQIFEFYPSDRVEHLLLAIHIPTAKLYRRIIGRKEVLHYFERMVKDTVSYRERNNVVRNDFMHLLIQLKNRGFVDDDKSSSAKAQDDDISNWKLSDGDLAAQAMLFFSAGFETSSTTMSYALYELALNPEVQRRLHQEVDETLQRTGGRFTYDAVMGMPYLDKVISETLRKYPPITILPRKTTRSYQIPGSKAVVDKDIAVAVPIYALHHDPRYFPDPERFDPERFSEEEKTKRHPYVYLPFGEGPRNCVGMRLGLLQAKIGLAHLMSKIEFQKCDETEIPIEYDPLSIVLMPATGLHLRAKRRSV
ncbi:probable cytochrome P450 6a13 [Schistocerca serialis cubense]|uniref:probable cytochrome P450 6a13 n=1 Tax=Schistocerca serialis cubense TaxID=2023355 RepID=UPI00214E5D5F|nr:probable cytochrome P450 6a13 [Schistocerca serialis cubense]